MVGVRLRIALVEPAVSVCRRETGGALWSASPFLSLVAGVARNQQSAWPGARSGSRRIGPRRRVAAARTLRPGGACAAVAARNARRLIQAALVASEAASSGPFADRASLCGQSLASAIRGPGDGGEAGESSRGRAGCVRIVGGLPRARTILAGQHRH